MSIQTGIITAVRYKALGRGKVCEVKVEVDGRVTAWLPKIGNAGWSIQNAHTSKSKRPSDSCT